jgi:hypothetical protein
MHFVPYDLTPIAVAETPTEGPPLVCLLFESAEAVNAGREKEASTLLGAILDRASPSGDALQRLARLFALGLKARLKGDLGGIGNLYVQGPDPRDMLAAFQVLQRETPFIRFGYATANRVLAGALGDAGRIHIVDIGIGAGAQWLAFLDLVAGRFRDAPSIRLTGIDVPAPGGNPRLRLQQVGRILAERASELGIPFTFDPVAGLVEELDLGALHARPGEPLVVNAVFALHHLHSSGTAVDGSSHRNTVLRRVHDLRPDVLTLVEPESEHNSLPFVPRVAEAMLHYLTVFEALDGLLPRDQPERATLEQDFFGREIFNVIVGEGVERVERHERHWSWHDRLTGQGFEPLDMSGLAGTLEDELQPRAPFGLKADQGALFLTWRTQRLIAASAWKPRGGNMETGVARRATAARYNRSSPTQALHLVEPHFPGTDHRLDPRGLPSFSCEK